MQRRRLIPDRIAPHGSRMPSVAGIVLAAALLSGCASSGNATLSPFADPAHYDLYDCAQLNTARKPLAEKLSELRGLMAKPETGAAGSLVSGVAYQSDFTATKAQLDLIDQNRRRNNCGEIVPDTPATPSTQSRRGHRR